MTKYYIDVENVGVSWIPLVGMLGDGDRIALYTSKNTSVHYGSLIPAMTVIQSGQLEIREGWVRGAGDSALDYFLMGEANNDLKRDPLLKAIIVSNDKGYDDFIAGLDSEGYHIRRVNAWLQETEPGVSGRIPGQSLVPSRTEVQAASIAAVQEEDTGDAAVIGADEGGWQAGDALYQYIKNGFPVPGSSAQGSSGAGEKPFYQQASAMHPASHTTAAQGTSRKGKLTGAALHRYIENGFRMTVQKMQGRKHNYLTWYNYSLLADAFIQSGGNFLYVQSLIKDKHKRQIFGCLIPVTQRERLKGML